MPWFRMRQNLKSDRDSDIRVKITVDQHGSVVNVRKAQKVTLRFFNEVRKLHDGDGLSGLIH